MGPARNTRREGRSPGASPIDRWECHCQEPPVLLATYDAHGTINIKARDRYWTVQGTVKARCPKCGAEHTFDPAARQPVG
jgi:hypothetical protein